MFKSKKSKQQAINTVDNLLTTYLQTTDKKITKSKQKSVKKGRKNNQHEATTILNMNAQIGNFKENKANLKKFKEKERKLRNKELKKYKLIEEKIQRQSKLEHGDENEINTVLKEKITKITAVDKFLNDDEDLNELQEDVLTFSNKPSTKTILKEISQKEQLAAKRRNAKLEDFNRKISRGHIAVAGLTPGLAQPGDDDSESDEDEDENEEVNDGSNLDNFKDDFDDYN